ncbi:MAG: methionyl-tRNA formyltransferase [Anaerolineae bacterium]
MARIAFLGTPDYAVPILQACIDQHQVQVVVTQPDRYGGRGRRELLQSPVKELARRAGVPVLQPARLSRDEQALALLAAAECDVFVLAAYGQILRPNVLSLPRHGVIGVHASLLPRWRGASPVAAAIRAGDAWTGVTLMLTEAGLDTGPIIASDSIPIDPADTTETLTRRLAVLGAALLTRELPGWLCGGITARPQDDARATYAPEIAKQDGRIDWNCDAVQIERHIRAMTSWPGAFTTTATGTRLVVWQARVAAAEEPGISPGTVTRTVSGPAVVTGKGLLVLQLVQPAGRGAMPAEAYVRGQPNLVGSVLA